MCNRLLVYSANSIIQYNTIFWKDAVITSHDPQYHMILSAIVFKFQVMFRSRFLCYLSLSLYMLPD